MLQTFIVSVIPQKGNLWSLTFITCIHNFNFRNTQSHNTTAFSGEGAALIIHLVHQDIQGFSHSGLSTKATTDHHYLTAVELNDG